MHAASIPTPEWMTDVSQPLLNRRRICIYSPASLITSKFSPAQVSLSNNPHTPAFSSEGKSATMKATLISAILLTLSAVDAKKHRLCCCSGIDEDAPGKWSDKSITCVQKPNEQIVKESKGSLIMSNQKWSFEKDKKYPFNKEMGNWVCPFFLPPPSSGVFVLSLGRLSFNRDPPD